MDEEEVHTAHARERGLHLHLNFFLGGGLPFFSGDLDHSAGACLARLVFKLSLERLIPTRDDLMHRELGKANEIVTFQICHVGSVVDIVDLDLVVLTLLEVILHVEAFDPYGTKIVHNYFCHANSLPVGADLFVEDSQAIGPGKGIQVRQILTCKVKTDGLD